MTTVPRGRRPKIGYDSFAEITDVPVAEGGIAPDGVTFDGELSPEEETDVRALLESMDDADMVKRANIRALRDAVVADPSLANVAALALANTAYGLGEQ